MSRFASSLALAALLVAAAAGPGWPSDALRPGEVLGAHNWQKAQGLLPPEVLRHYEQGEYANEIADWPHGSVKWGAVFLRHTRENGERLALDERGSIVDKQTGKRPEYIYGLPFPRIDADDPQAATKILWNYFFQRWSSGNFHTLVQLNWLNRRGFERSALQEVYFLFYTGQRREFAPPANPMDLYSQFLAKTVAPTDVYGIIALSWRYRDPQTRDSVWAYVPALRRVRAVSPANRSDGFLGSDLSQDDGPLFDGKPEDFGWKLVREQEVLRLLDPYSLKGEARLDPLPGGGWRVVFAKRPMIGFQDPAWKGVPWAPLNFVLAKRKCWVIEGVPKDPYYLFGRLELYIDQETYQGAYNRKFDWSGSLVNTYSVFASVTREQWGDEIYGSGLFYQGAENLRQSRATVVTVPQDIANPAADWRIRLEPSFFDSQALVRFGK